MLPTTTTSPTTLDSIASGVHACARDRGRHAGRRTLVVGVGLAAFAALRDIAALKRHEPSTEVTWGVRRADVARLFDGADAFALDARGPLGMQLRALVDEGLVRLATGIRVDRVASAGDALVVETEAGRRLGPFDEIVVAGECRPERSITRIEAAALATA